MREEKRKATCLALAAALVAAMLTVPAAAFAGPKFEELEKNAPADITDADALYKNYLAQLGTDTAAIKAFQTECGITPASGALGPQTQRCLRGAAAGAAQGRAHSAALKGEADAAKAEKATCDTALSECREKLAATARDRDDALAKLRSGAGDEFGELEGVCKTLDLSQFVGHCDPVSQNIVCRSDASEPLGFRLGCVAKRLDVRVASLIPRPDGTADATFAITPQKGTLTPATLPWQVPPPPLPEPPGTCDGAGGALLCYVLPASAVVVGGLLIADAASEDFNLVEVRR